MRIRNAAQAGGRFVNGSLIRRSGLIVAALSLTLLFGAGIFLNSGSSARASDSETAALIGDFNQYRASHGVPALSTSSSANADAQAAADKTAAKCGYYLPSGHSVAWESYAYGTASALMNAYETDNSTGWRPIDDIVKPSYHSAGVGRVASTNCSFGPIWTIILDTSGGGGGTTNPPTNTPSPTPTHTPSPAPTHSPTPTPATATPTPTATASQAPTESPPPSGADTPTPTPTPAPSVSPTATTPAFMPGDVDCNGTINMNDVILLLEAAANVPAFAPCLGPTGVDCTGGVDAADALVLLEFLENIPYHLPDGCPPLGSPTPSPTTVPTLEPTQTATPTPGVTPIPAGINHCELAMVAYQTDTAESLNSEESCAPGAGTAYDCVFSTDDHKAVCVSSSSDFPDYTCSFTGAGFADCVPDTGAPEYQCFDNGAHVVECLPAHAGYAWYNCAVSGDDVTCTSAPPFPDFACRHEGAEFSCLALASPTPTAPPG